MASPVSITPAQLKTDGRPVIILKAPYHPDCAKRAKLLGGYWNATQKQWQFDPRDELRVCELARELYGTDGRIPVDLVTVRLTHAEKGQCGIGQLRAIRFAGRELAFVYGRDSGAKLGENTVAIRGSLSSSGSMRYPAIVCAAGTTLEARDLPRPAVDASIDEATRYDWTVEIIDNAPTAAQVAATMGAGISEQSEAEKLYAQIRALPESAQVDIRNRLLQDL